MSPDEIKRLKVCHVACLNDFTYFTRYFFKKQYHRKWKQWDHLLIIADALKEVFEGKTKRLIINCAPRYGKTELGVKMFIAYGLALNPSAKFIHVTYSDDLALDNSEAARDLVSSEEYQQLFPYVKLKPSSKGKKKWYTEAGGGVYAVSFGGQITGFGAGQVDPDDEDFNEFIDGIESSSKKDWLGQKALFAGAIIMDDSNKVDDADSELLRNRVNERYDSTISNRVNSRNTPILNMQQRTHENDLSGNLIKKQKKIEEGGIWKVLSLPSIKEDGTALCPEKHTIEELRALEQHNDIVFQRQHMQNPKPRAGLLLPIDDLQFYDPESMEETLNDPEYCYVPCDPAGDGPDDFATGPFKLIGNKIYVTDMIYNASGSDENEIAMVKMIIAHRAKAVGVESTFGWVEVSKRVKEHLYSLKWDGDYRNLRPKSNKHSRILNQASFVRNHFVFRKDWDAMDGTRLKYPQYAKFMRILTSYMKIQEVGSMNKHDDAPDLCCMAAQFYERTFPHLWAIVIK